MLPRAFDIQACDYVMKPFDEDRLFLALDRAKEALKNHQGTGYLGNIAGCAPGPRSHCHTPGFPECHRPSQASFWRRQGKAAVNREDKRTQSQP
jgi:hypothetical protein